VTLAEWTEAISAELKGAGFEVERVYGFPLLKMPASQDERVRLLKFKTTLPSDQRIYKEGMLFVPTGSWKGAEQQKAKKEAQP
jgi:hypothetical protein